MKKHELFFNFRKSTNAVIGGIIIVLFILIALFAPLLAPKPPNAQSLKDALTSPCWRYPLGTDEFGRSILSRIIFGARVSLNIALIASAVALGIGVPLGALAGYYGGVTDSIVQGLVDLTWAFPTILAALAIMFILGPGLHSHHTCCSCHYVHIGAWSAQCHDRGWYSLLGGICADNPGPISGVARRGIRSSGASSGSE